MSLVPVFRESCFGALERVAPALRWPKEGEVMLSEEFKNGLPERTVVYLNEQKVTTLQQAAILAEEFALMHKSGFNKHDSSFSRGFPQKCDTCSPDEWTTFLCHSPGHVVADCMTLKWKQQASVLGPAS